MLALVDQALLRMADEQGLEIELGLRIEPLAAEASAAGVGDIQALRDTYRDAVLDYRGLSAAWQDIRDMHKLRVLGGLAEQVGALWQVLVTGERGHGIRAF